MRKVLRSLWYIITAPFRLIRWILRKIANFFRSIVVNIQNFFIYEEEDTPLPDAFAKTVQHPQEILVHIDILRKHLLRAVLVLVCTTALSFAFIRQIMEFLSYPLPGGLPGLIAIEVTENIGTVMRVALLSGFAMSLPYIIVEIYLFVAPGLSPKTRIKGLLAIPVAFLLFLAGMAFAFFVMLPVALPFLFNFMGLTTEARPQSYFNFVTNILFWIGIAFEFPLIVYFLAGFGILTHQVLIAQWRIAIVIIAIIAAMITPTVDPVNMALVMGPMIILYILSIILAYIAVKGRKQVSEPASV